MSEFRLFDSPGAEVAQIVTDGSTFKPFVNAIGHVNSEARFEIDESGISVSVNDPANVFLIHTHLGADAFKSFEIDGEDTVGADVGELQSLIRRARKGHDDELTVSIRERELTATVARGYDNHNVVSQGTMQLIDPDSIRDSPNLPEIDRTATVELELAALVDALSYAMGASEHVSVSIKGVNQHANALYIGGETDTRTEAAAIDNIGAPIVGESLYSSDYLCDVLDGISGISAPTVTLVYDEEFPISFKMQREDVPHSVEYMVAPRVKS